MESVARFGSIPIVETGIRTAEDVYSRLKRSSTLLNWSFETAEGVVQAAVESVRPAVKIMEGPLYRLDQIMCKSLDMVEQRVPSVYLPPQMMYWNTKEYMSDHLMRPVIKRANSVKQLGTAVLDCRVSNYAAGRLDGAFDVAERCVDRYLTVDQDANQVDGSSKSSDDQLENMCTVNDNECHALQTIHRGQRLSRKLKRRLTQRTVMEARALKKQSKEAIHILIYAAELIVTDPKQAAAKAQELWTYLSKAEPENQARPQNLEQLIVLITRESARRVVHFLNFTRESVAKVPNTVVHSTTDIFHRFVYAADSLIKATHLDAAKSNTLHQLQKIVAHVQNTYDELTQYTNSVLERLAIFLSGRLEAEKITTATPMRRRVQIRTNDNPVQQNNINGGY